MDKKNTDISARVAETIELLGETANSFAKTLGYKRSQTVYDIISGKSAPSYDFFNKFANAEFSVCVNIKWLLTGKGQPIEQSKDVVEELPLSFMDKIIEQAEEIGRLKEQIRQMEKEKENDVQGAQTSSIANVG
ncbi:MAG: hypothetical protein ACRCUJ_14445 [Phocaeicola sp.]